MLLIGSQIVNMSPVTKHVDDLRTKSRFFVYQSSYAYQSVERKVDR